MFNLNQSSKLLVLALLFSVQACQAVLDTAAPAPEEAPAQQELSAPSILAPTPAAPPQPITIEPGLDLRSELDKIRVKNVSGADQSFNQAIDSKKTTIIALVKPGCIYCESLLAVLRGARYKGKANIVFVLDSTHANTEEFKKKANDNKKLGHRWLYDYSNKFTDTFAVTAFPQFIVMGRDGKVIKHQKGLVLPENKESLANSDYAVVLQTLARSTVSWLEQY